MNKKILPGMALLASAILLGACGGGGSSQTLQNSPNLTEPEFSAAQGLEQQANSQQQTGSQQEASSQQEVAFDFDFSALLEKEVDNTAYNDFTVKALSANLMTGTMQVENLDTAEVESHEWTINLDESDLANVQSLKTLVLRPANYLFSLALDRGDHQYAGTAIHTLAVDATDPVQMTIRPVIGDSQVDVTILDSLVDFKFSYSDAELSDAGLLNPSMGITIDSNAEQIFTLDPATGLSEFMYLSLIPGNYDISLRLLDGGIQVGRSVQQQETGVSVVAGLDVTMDLIPLYGEMALSLAVEGDDAAVNIQVPAEVIEEAGDLSNLQALLTVVGPDYPLEEIELALAPDGTVYTASTVLTEMNYGELTFELLFLDLSERDELGGCVETAVINSGVSTVECKLELRRRSVVAGSLLSSLGVSVVDVNGDAVSGAVVSIDGEEVAITNSAAFSTAGYAKLYVKPGQRVIRAQSGADYGEASYDSQPLGVANIDLVLDQVEGPNILFADDFNNNQTGSAAPITYWFGCLAEGGPEGYVDAGILYLGSRYNTTGSDWCWGTSALTDHSFTETEITDAGGFTVSVDVADAHVDNAVVTVGIGEELATDPSNFYPHQTADAIVNVRDNEVQILLYEAGTNIANTSYTMPIATRWLENVTIDVETTSFAAGESATLNVIVNGDPDLVPPVNFDWDGGSNHIELKGSAGIAEDGGGTNYIEFENVTVSPR